MVCGVSIVGQPASLTTNVSIRVGRVCHLLFGSGGTGDVRPEGWTPAHKERDASDGGLLEHEAGWGGGARLHLRSLSRRCSCRWPGETRWAVLAACRTTCRYHNTDARTRQYQRLTGSLRYGIGFQCGIITSVIPRSAEESLCLLFPGPSDLEIPRRTSD